MSHCDYNLVLEHADELAQLESLDNGKPRDVARTADVPLAADMFHWRSPGPLPALHPRRSDFGRIHLLGPCCMRLSAPLRLAHANGQHPWLAQSVTPARGDPP